MNSYADVPVDLYRQGLTFLQNGSPDEAIPVLSGLIDHETILVDYLLLWRAEAYFTKGEPEKALNDIKRILNEYMSSPVVREARRMRIEIMMSWKPDEVDGTQKLFEEYISLYPRDSDMRFRFAEFLSLAGNSDRYDEIITGLYREGFDFPNSALLPDPGGLLLDDLIARGDELFRSWRFNEAEEVYGNALIKARDETVEEIKEKIALCVFRQKRYAVSAGLFAALNDRYMEAVSYLRAGDRKKFLVTLTKLKRMQDPRAGALLLALAAEERDGGHREEALALYRTVKREYPFKEDARWGIGWTEFLAGNFSVSHDIFARMHKQYDSDKYLYWMIRSAEKRKSVSKEAYSQLCSRDGYYGLLGCIRSGMQMRKVSLHKGHSESLDPTLFKRYNLLKELGLRQEAVNELKQLTEGFDGKEEIVLLSRKLREIGEYKRSISVATRLPYDEKIHDLFYPIAYSDVIKKVSDRFDLNPLYILSVAREESRLDPDARSVAGAVGLMQLMPETAGMVSRSLRHPVPAEEGFYEVETNILLGSYYLKTLLNRFGSLILATAAYNAGGNAVERWLSRLPSRTSDEFVEEIPYHETRNYVKKVLSTFYQYEKTSTSGELGDNILMNLELPARKASPGKVS